MKKLLALVLALALMLSFAACGAPTAGKANNEYSEFALAAVVLPEMAPYPNEMDYIDEKSGSFDDDSFSIAYDAWWSDLRAQRDQYEGYNDGLDGFFADGIREFMSSGDGQNKVFSPLNVYMALCMLAEITDSDSRAQILSALGCSDMDTLRKQANAIWNASYRSDGAVTSVMSSSLWLRDGISYVQETMDTLAETYYAESFSGEMGSDEYNAALQSWLNEKTGGFLEDYASMETFDEATILAIATTVLFSAKWTDEFSENNTEKALFHLLSDDDSTVECEFMNKTTSSSYYWGEKFTSVPLNLEGGRMWFILPDEGVSINELWSDDEAMSFILNPDQHDKTKYLTVNLSVPKFDVSSETDLKAGLAALGITDVFDEELSDFSPAVGDTDGVFLSKVNHSARVAVDEEGVTAAAYTLMEMAGSGAPPDEEVDFILNRPFIFVIEGQDGLPLFTGAVYKPM